jgi:ATP-dependent RNA helicase DDX60
LILELFHPNLLSHSFFSLLRYSVALQQALAASNDPGNRKYFVHEPDGRPTSFGTALRCIHKVQHCFPTVTEQQMSWMCNTTLEEFCRDESSDSYLALSTKVIEGLGYVHSDLTLAMNHNILSTVWEMRDYLPESVYLCSVLKQMYFRFCHKKTKSFKERDSTQNDFLSVLLHVVDRHPPANGEKSLQQLLRVSPSGDGKAVNEEAETMWLETERRLEITTNRINDLPIDQSEKDRLLLVLHAGSWSNKVGPPLDKSVYEMLVSKLKGFLESQTTERRNALKNRIVRLGQICRIVHNNIQQPHGAFGQLEVHFRRMFSNIKYSVHDMMKQLMDQPDVSYV